ncbi:RHS repeat domain-containing protein [Aquimarina rhabdastrellae]
MKHYSKLWCTLLVCIISSISYAQIGDDGNGEAEEGPDYLAQMERSFSLPLAPEAAAFQKYGEIPANHYTGTPQIDIPIVSYKGLEMDIPIGLTYDASGIKVNQPSTPSGLGWNLIMGGAVSRVVNGLPDNTIGGLMHSALTRAQTEQYIENRTRFTSVEAAIEYYQYLDQVNKNAIDTHPDYFSVNAFGLNAHIVLDYRDNFRPKVLNNPRIKVQASSTGGYIGSWIITNEDGTKFYFEKTESVSSLGNDTGTTYNIAKNYIASWRLTRMISPNGLDTYEFYYQDYGSFTAPQFLHEAVTVTNTIKDFDFNYTGVDSYHTFQPISYNQEVFLSSIKHNSKTIVNLAYKKRYDRTYEIAGSGGIEATDVKSGIASISVLDPQTEEMLQKVVFEHSYFGLNANQTAESSDPDEIRLKLDALHYYGQEETYKNSYRFAYEQPEKVPSLKSKGQDYLGYNNGAAGNTDLYPELQLGNAHFTGAKREPNPLTARIGTLTEITYPTGGKTVFEYESHQSSSYKARPSETIATLTVRGDQGDGTGCLGNCRDKYGTPPKIVSRIIRIPSTGKYELDFSNPQSSSQFGVFLISRPSGEIAYEDFVGYGGNFDNHPAPVVWYKQSGGSELDRNVELPAGLYQLTIAVAGSPTVVSDPDIITDPNPVRATVGLKITKHYKTNVVTHKLHPGIRLKKRINYSENNQISTIKNYRYTETINSDYSSASNIYEPKLYSSSTSKSHDGETFVYTTTISRSSVARAGSGVHIGYKNVFEIDGEINIVPVVDNDPQGEGEDEGGNIPSLVELQGMKNGYTEYQFYGGKSGLVAVATAPYYNNFRADFKAGKSKEVLRYTTSGDTLSREQSIYRDYNIDAVPGMSVITVENTEQKYVAFRANEDGTISIEHLEPKWSCIGSLCALKPGRPLVCNRPEDYPDMNIVGCINKRYTSLNGRVNVASISSGHLIETRATSYYGDQQITTTTQYEYDPTVDYVLRNQTTQQGEGILQKMTYRYPKDIANGTNIPGGEFETEEVAGIQALIAANRVSTPIQTETYQDGARIGMQRSTYKQSYSKTVPYRVYTAKGEDPLEQRAEFSYNLEGRPVLQQQTDGTITKYVWGYGGRYIIAQIQGLVPLTSDTPREDPAGYAIELSNNDDDRTIGTIGKEGALREKLNELRAAHPVALVTTYTYDPFIGVTSITDPKGYTIYYEYDKHNRLLQVKDAAGKLVSENQYHYKTQE